MKQTWFFDGQVSYSFKFVAPVEAQPVAGYSKSEQGPLRESLVPSPWKRMVNNTTITIGCNNIFGQDPPKAYNGNACFPEFIYDSSGRFVYASLKKQF